MARKRKAPAKKQELALVFEDGYYWIISGTKRLNVGRNRRMAEEMLKERQA